MCSQNYASDTLSVDSSLLIIKDIVSSQYSLLRQKKVPANYLSVELRELECFSISSEMGVTLINKHETKTTVVSNVKFGSSFSPKWKFLTEFFGTNNYHKDDIFKVISANEMRAVICQNIQKNCEEFFENIGATDKLDSTFLSSDSRYYSPNEVVQFYEKPIPNANVDCLKWETVLNDVGKMYRDPNGRTKVNFKFQAENGRRNFVTSEGAEIVNNISFFTLYVEVVTKQNGEERKLKKTYTSTTESGLPTYLQLVKDIGQLIKLIDNLFYASCLEGCDGPVLFGGMATGVIMHELFGHRLEASTRNKDLEFMYNHMDKKILPDFVQVYSDPTISEFNGLSLIGHYDYDDEGSPAERVNCVVDGILKNLLRSRHAMCEGERSNGHGRSSIGNEPIARQSNLFVQSSASIPDSMIRKLLIEEIVKTGKEYGYFIPTITNGSVDGWAAPLTKLMAAKNRSTEVRDISELENLSIKFDYAYKVFSDGRPDQLIQGTTISISPENICKSILAMATTQEVDNGFCTIGSSQIPVSLIAPKMLVSSMKWEVKSFDSHFSRDSCLVEPKDQIDDLKFDSDSATIMNALKDEIKYVSKLYCPTSTLPYADYRIKRLRIERIKYVEGKCVDEYLHEGCHGKENFFFCIDKKMIEGEANVLSNRFALPFSPDYYYIRHMLREKVLEKYHNVLGEFKQPVDSVGRLFTSMPPYENIETSSFSTSLSYQDLCDLSSRLSLLIRNEKNMLGTSVAVYQKLEDCYRITTGGQISLTPRVSISIVGNASFTSSDERNDLRSFTLTFSDNDTIVIRRQFIKCLKAFKKQNKHQAPSCNIKEPVIYEGPVLLVDEVVPKYLLNNSILQKLVVYNKKSLRNKIGDKVMSEVFSLFQLAGLSSYKGEDIYAHNPIDLEGTKMQDVLLVKNGLIKGKISGRYQVEEGSHSTGNELSGGIAFGPLRLVSSVQLNSGKLRKLFLNKSREAGKKYAYIIIQNRYGYRVIRVDVNTGEECILKATCWRESEGHIIATSKEEYVTQDGDECVSYICPKEVLFDNLKIMLR